MKISVLVKIVEKILILVNIFGEISILVNIFGKNDSGQNFPKILVLLKNSEKCRFG